MKQSYVLFPTRLGWMGLLGSPAGLRALILPQSSPQAVLSNLGKHLSGAADDPTSFGDLPERLRHYLNGQLMTFPDRLDLAEATSFQKAVWGVVQGIPYGETRSYAWCALQIGRPGAARAVGRAVGRNPLPLIIPCHRVIASSGELSGFSAGPELKQILLEIEGCHT